MSKKTNWEDIGFWMAIVSLLAIITYLFVTGRAFK